ncbi:MAG: penicillin-binding protein activator LpoB [Spirochaetaceae bacterium]|nr:penicillin-binding protein activator LpoB [Spirochaetaceae bacterium]
MRIVVLLLLAILTSCGSKPAVKENSVPVSVSVPEKERELTVTDIKNAVSKHKDLVIDTIPAKSRIALLDINSFDQDLGDFATEEIIMSLVKAKKFSIIDRDSIETLRKEQRFQASGEVNDATAVAIGKFVGASVVITGAIHRRYGRIDFTLKILDVETSEIIDLVPIQIWEDKI